MLIIHDIQHVKQALNTLGIRTDKVDTINPSSYALVWEEGVLAKNPSERDYCVLMSVMHEYSYGRLYYENFMKPEARTIFFTKNNEMGKRLRDAKVKPEKYFTCQGIFSVNRASAMDLGFNPETESLFDFDTGYEYSLKVYDMWYNVFRDEAKAIVNYRYYLNLYEINTTLSLNNQEHYMRKVLKTWQVRFQKRSTGM